MIRLVLILAAVAPYLRTLAFGYVFDDTYAIRGNASLNGWLSFGRVWIEQFGGESGHFVGLYRPLTATLFAIVWNAGGKWPLWFHVVALVLHAGATLLVWRLLRSAVSKWPAFLAALWFAVHPIHVEAVANVTNVSEVLVAIWTLLLALFLVRKAHSETPLSWSSSAIAAALYVAAMLSKESGAMTAPVALLVAWGWHRELAPSVAWMVNRWWRVIVGFGFAVIVVGVARALVLGGPLTGQPIAALGIADMTAGERIVAMISLVPAITQLLVWPSGVNPHYGPSTFPEQRAAFAALGLFIIAVVFALGAWMARRSDRRLLAALCVATLSFLPASNLLVPTGQVLAERTLYLPSIGVVMALAVLLDRASASAVAMRSSQVTTRLATAGLLLVLLWSGANAARWTEHWRNHETLFARMIAADPAGYAGYWLAGIEATQQNRPDEGLAQLEKAYALERRGRGLILDLGASLTNHRQFARAAAVYREGLKLAPGDSTLHARLRALPTR